MPPSRRNSRSPPAADESRIGALSQAIDLAASPTPALVAELRRRPLPRDAATLIRLASGCPETLAEAASATGREPDFLLHAAEFYLRQAMCFPGADPFRTLGVAPGAPREQMRANMRGLAMWLHPDRSGDAWNAALLRRVLEAWGVAGGAAEGRPEGVGPRQARGRGRRTPAYKPRWISRPLPKAKPAAAAARRARRALRLAIILAGTLFPVLGAFCLSGLATGSLRIADDAARLGAAAGQEPPAWTSAPDAAS